jgi:hypothetical protein
MKVLRVLILSLLAVLVAPTAGWAADDVTVRSRDVALGRAVKAPGVFETIGVHWRGAGSIDLRARSVSGRWGSWRPAQPEGDDLPDAGSAENHRHGWRIGNPWFVGRSTALQVRARGRVSAVRAFFVHAPEHRIPLRRLSIAGSPALLTRSAWSANESLRRTAPKYAPALRFAVVHHTAGAAGSNPAEAAAIVRSILAYHVQANGWDDIGYNFLVDRFGNVYEGRWGGVDRAVVGAHALGFNRGSVGVALIGTYSSAAPPRAELTALEKLLAWRLDLVHIDPLSKVLTASTGNAQYPAGTDVSLRVISGHRDTGPTSCPGNAAYARLGEIARQTAALGAPKLYDPHVAGAVGGAVRFTARLSHSLPWTVTVRDAQGRTVAAGEGVGTAVGWTWDSRSARPGASYPWEINAGGDVRPAVGTLGAALKALTLTTLAAKPSRVDGTTATSSTISFTLSVPAHVTAELLSSTGAALATLLEADKPAGKQSFVFTPHGIPDGAYRIRVSARDASGRTVQASVNFLISTALVQFTASSQLASPNGDGRNDSVTFTVGLAVQADVSVSLVAGKTSIPLVQANLPPGTHVLPWTGRGLDGLRVADGRYRATIAVGTAPFAVTQWLPLTVDTRAPRLALTSIRPPLLNVTEPATITGSINGRAWKAKVGASIFRIPVRWLRSVRATARDVAGNTSRTVTWPR